MEELQRILPKAPGVGEVFQLLRSQPMTRAQLCAATGQARSTIAARLDSLVEVGLLGRGKEETASMGRPASLFHFRPEAGTTLAIDIGARHVRIGTTDLGGRILAQQHLDLSVEQGPEVVLSQAIKVGRKLLAGTDLSTSPLAGVGVGVPGPVEYDTGRPSSPPIMPGWDGWDIVENVQKAFNTPVHVDNDANIMAIGEHALAWRNTNDLLFVKLATGVGCGIILDGRIRRGAQGASGDIGHMRVPNGPPTPCHCGGAGCLEAIVGIDMLAGLLTEAGSPARGGADIVALVRAGDANASQLMRETGRTLGEVLAGVVSLLNPSVIVIGGVLAQAHMQLIAGIREAVYAKSLPLATKDLRIVASVAGSRAGIVGASTLVSDHVLAPAAVEALVERTDTGRSA